MTETGQTPPPPPSSSATSSQNTVNTNAQTQAIVLEDASSRPPQTRGEVVNVNTQTREVSVRTNQGDVIRLQVPAEFIDAQKIQVGDRVAVRAGQAAQRAEAQIILEVLKSVKSNQAKPAQSTQPTVQPTTPVSSEAEINRVINQITQQPRQLGSAQRAVSYPLPNVTTPQNLEQVLRQVVQNLSRTDVSAGQKQAIHSSLYTTVVEVFNQVQAQISQSQPQQINTRGTESFIRSLLNLQAPTPQLSQNVQQFFTQSNPVHYQTSLNAAFARQAPLVQQPSSTQNAGHFQTLKNLLVQFQLTQASQGQQTSLPQNLGSNQIKLLNVINLAQFTQAQNFATPVQLTASAKSGTSPFIGITLPITPENTSGTQLTGPKQKGLFIITPKAVHILPQVSQNIIQSAQPFSVVLGHLQATPQTQTLPVTNNGLQALFQNMLATSPQGFIPTAIGQEPAEALLPNFFAQLTPMTADSLWPDLTQFINELGQQSAALQAQVAQMIPNASQPVRMTATTLFFIAALAGGDVRSWLGQRAINMVGNAGGKDLIDRLQRQFGQLSTSRTDNVSGEWKPLPLPMMIGEEIHMIHLFTRQNNDGDNDETEDNIRRGKATRFVMNFDQSKLGRMQLDGLVQSRHLDMILRAEDHIPQELKDGLRERYFSTMEATGLSGQIIFKEERDGWVDVLAGRQNKYNPTGQMDD